MGIPHARGDRREETSVHAPGCACQHGVQIRMHTHQQPGGGSHHNPCLTLVIHMQGCTVSATVFLAAWSAVWMGSWLGVVVGPTCPLLINVYYIRIDRVIARGQALLAAASCSCLAAKPSGRVPPLHPLSRCGLWPVRARNVREPVRLSMGCVCSVQVCVRLVAPRVSVQFFLPHSHWTG